MDRFRSRRVQIQTPQAENNDGETETLERGNRLRPSENNVIENQEPFMGVKVRRRASLHRDYRGDYLDVPSQPSLMKILDKQGDRKVLFADKVLKFTGSGKMKRRVLLITDFAIYIVDPESGSLKRRIALAAVDKLCLSELSDNFFAIIIPSEYDILMASTRKSEIVTVLVDATKSTSDYELEVGFSNTFEYHAAAELIKEVQFEEVEDLSFCLALIMLGLRLWVASKPSALAYPNKSLGRAGLVCSLCWAGFGPEKIRPDFSSWACWHDGWCQDEDCDEVKYQILGVVRHLVILGIGILEILIVKVIHSL
ncbi:Myosin tail 2 [Macleaya cordata]|uniref:Myosin tail 2 n=1 Tax=Macleaya cordata TaxID=56857 RepID=A0A200Q7H1_MACCD|nr:Myosin tail 2 [Macleaya cordata]